METKLKVLRRRDVRVKLGAACRDPDLRFLGSKTASHQPSEQTLTAATSLFKFSK